MPFYRYISIIFLLFCCYPQFSQSIFDVYRDSNDIINKIDIKNLAVMPSEDANSVDPSNPFEVDHIPIRKNQIADKKVNSSVSYPERSSQPSLKISNKDVQVIVPLVVLLLSALMMGFVVFNNKRFLGNIRQAIVNRNYMSSFKGKIGKNFLPQFGVMYLVFVLNLALFIYLVFHQSIQMTPMKTIGLTVIGLILLYLGRHLFMSLFGWIFELETETSAYSFVIAIVNVCIGIFLIPINLLLAFGPELLGKPLILLAFGIIVLFLTFRYFRGALISSKYILNRFFQFFLYFCTFEIVPVLIILYFLNII